MQSMVPTLRLIFLVIVGAPIWLLTLVFPGGWLGGTLYLILLLTLSVKDFRWLPGAEELKIDYQLPPRFSLDAVQNITLLLTNNSGKHLKILVSQELPSSLEPLSSFLPILSVPGSAVELKYSVRSLERGHYQLGPVILRIRQEGGLFQKQLKFGNNRVIKIYPHFLGVDEYRLLARIEEQEQAVRRPRYIPGQGTDFESLRNYVPGEDLRHVEWKASAKRGVLISRNLQTEKGQQLSLLIDAGRRMTDIIGKHARFEYALNAAVMVSYVAQKRGDTVAVATFSNQIESFLPPTRGKAIMPGVLEALCKIQVREVESDYWQVVADMMARLKKRSLLIMMTDVLDPPGSSGLINNLVRAASKHLVMCVVLSAPHLTKMAELMPFNLETTYLKAAACHLKLQRHLALEQMRKKGILILETDPQHLSVQLIRRYLEIRKANLQ